MSSSLVVGGAWTHDYRKGDTGTLGESLASLLDNLGWTLRAWKYELDLNGYRTGMVLDSPTLGGPADAEIRNFQNDQGLKVDGRIGPITGKRLLRKRIVSTSLRFNVSTVIIDGIVAHESAYDLGAIGYLDHGDRGLTQQHLVPGGPINLSQAIRPALAVPRLATHIARLSIVWDEDAAIASWNIGEGGAEWWWQAGKPRTGSPSWWNGTDDLSARATAYVTAVRATGV